MGSLFPTEALRTRWPQNRLFSRWIPLGLPAFGVTLMPSSLRMTLTRFPRFTERHRVIAPVSVSILQHTRPKQWLKLSPRPGGQPFITPA